MIMSAPSIEGAWFLACKRCMKLGYVQKVERGSFVGHERKQLLWLALQITEPWIRPLATFFKGAPIATDHQIEDYFANYLMSSEKKPNEAYTYGARMAPFLPRIVDMLRETPNTNQATIEVGRPEDVLLDDPPCLRVLSWKNTLDGLVLSSFWRSWDGYSGFPTNVGGLELLNEYVAQETGLKRGPLFVYSDGFHLYDFAWEFFSLSGFVV